MTVLFTPFIDWNLKEMALTFPPPPRIDVFKKKKNWSLHLEHGMLITGQQWSEQRLYNP